MQHIGNVNRVEVDSLLDCLHHEKGVKTERRCEMNGAGAMILSVKVSFRDFLLER